MMLGSREITKRLQIFTLIIETAGVLAVFPRLRVWIGLGLVGFYGGVLATFDYGFQFNALLTALYFLPVEQIVTKARGLERSKNSELEVVPRAGGSVHETAASKS